MSGGAAPAGGAACSLSASPAQAAAQACRGSSMWAAGARVAERPVGTRWFLVDAAWLARLARYSAQGGAAPGPVDNRALLDGAGELRARLVENFDYVVVCAEAWAQLVGELGGGPAIERVAVADAAYGVALDVYPVRVTVGLAGAPAESRELLVSRKASLGALADLLAVQLGSTQFRLYGELYGGDLVEIRDRDGVVRLARTAVGDCEWCDAHSRMRLLLELSRPDGSWPRDAPLGTNKRAREAELAVSASTSRSDDDGGGSGGGGNSTSGDGAGQRKRKGSSDSPLVLIEQGGVRGAGLTPPPASAFATIPSVPRDQQGSGGGGGGGGGSAAFNAGLRLAHQLQLAQQLQLQQQALKSSVGNAVPGPAPGAAGLTNLGNTCYANAVLQCLMQAQQLVKWLVDEQRLSQLRELASRHAAALQTRRPLGAKLMLPALAELVRLCWSSQHSSVSPGALVAASHSLWPASADWLQHDAHEFLLLVLNSLHEETNRVTEHEQQQQQKQQQQQQQQQQRLPPPQQQHELQLQLPGGQQEHQRLALDSPTLEDLMVEDERRMALEEVGPGGSPGSLGVLSSPLSPSDDAPSMRQRAAEARARARLRDDSVVLDLFQGQYESRLQCEACGLGSSTLDVFLALSLPVCASVDAALRELTTREVLDAAEQWFCPRCRELRAATKKITLVSLPTLLVLHLQRFDSKGNKLQQRVSFPVEGLDLAPLVLHGAQGASMLDEDPEELGGGGGGLYDLFAVAKHHGSAIQGGHYTADVLCSDRVWRNMDDAGVVERPSPDGEDAEAYLLFYRRQLTPFE